MSMTWCLCHRSLFCGSLMPRLPAGAQKSYAGQHEGEPQEDGSCVQRRQCQTLLDEGQERWPLSIPKGHYT
eukprot:941922-Amphidinium_carterae.2